MASTRRHCDWKLTPTGPADEVMAGGVGCVPRLGEMIIRPMTCGLRLSVFWGLFEHEKE